MRNDWSLDPRIQGCDPRNSFAVHDAVYDGWLIFAWSNGPNSSQMRSVGCYSLPVEKRGFVRSNDQNSIRWLIQWLRTFPTVLRRLNILIDSPDSIWGGIGWLWWIPTVIRSITWFFGLIWAVQSRSNGQKNFYRYYTSSKDFGTPFAIRKR